MRKQISLVFVFIVITFMHASSSEPSTGAVWILEQYVASINTDKYDALTSQGTVLITTTKNRSFEIPMNVEWGKIAYLQALTAFYKNKIIDFYALNNSTKTYRVQVR